MRLTWSNFYIFLLSTNTVRKNKCGFKLKCLPLICNSGLEWQLDLNNNDILFYIVRGRYTWGTRSWQGLLCCPCLQFHFIVWRSAELNVFGVEEMALANMQIKNLEVKTVYLNMGKYKITSNVKLWKLSIYLYLFIYLQVNTSALSDMIDPSERKVSEFPTVGEKWCQN